MPRHPTLLPLALCATILLSIGCPTEGDDDDDNPVPEICNEGADLGDGPWFTDVTAELGLGIDGLDIQGGLVATTDIDGDRWPDLFLSRGNAGVRDDPADPVYRVRLLHNLGGTGFEDVTFSSGLTDTRDGSQGRAIQWAIFGDVDNDGDEDAFTATYLAVDTTDTGDQSEIMLNDGSGHFTLGPEQRFSDDPTYDAASGAAMTDHELDGVVDLYVGHHYNNYGYISSAGQDSLFVGDGSGGFSDVTAEVGLQTVASSFVADLTEGINHRPSWGVSACDIDGDGYRELITDAYGRQFNMLWRQDGDGSYTDIARDVGFASDDNEDYSDNLMYGTENWNDGFDDQPFRLGGNSSNTVCGDVDNDGDLDLLQIELRHEWAGQSSDMTELLINEGVGDGGAFARPGNEATGLEREHGGTVFSSWNEGDLGGALFDFDHDGRLDVLVTSSDYPYTHSLLWHQDADGTFTEVSEASGLLVHRAHGVTLIDYDRDGDLDVLLGTSLMRWEADDDPPRPDAAYMVLLRNDVGQDGNRLMIDLEGAGAGGANRSAIGARIVARAGGDVFVREVTGGYGLNGYRVQIRLHPHKPLI